MSYGDDNGTRDLHRAGVRRDSSVVACRDGNRARGRLEHGARYNNLTELRSLRKGVGRHSHHAGGSKCASCELHDLPGRFLAGGEVFCLASTRACNEGRCMNECDAHRA